MRKLGFSLCFSLSMALLGLSSTAHAHFNLIAPKPTTNDTSGGKGAPPCGKDTPAATPVAVQGGHPIDVEVKETVYHPGFYRLALSINSRAELPPGNVVRDAQGKILPADGSTKGISKTAEFQNPAVFPVLADNLWPHTSTPTANFKTQITLPNVNCDKCTLQVIQFMADHGWNGNGDGSSNGGYFYHHCSDLKITADPALPPFNAGGGTDGGTDAKPDGGTNGAAGTTGAAGTGAGAAGTGGGTGGTTGAAGTGAATAGTAGTSGAAGTGSATGAAGTGGGAAGTSGGGDSGGGGCAVAGGAASLGGLLLGLGALVAARRRRRQG